MCQTCKLSVQNAENRRALRIRRSATAKFACVKNATMKSKIKPSIKSSTAPRLLQKYRKEIIPALMTQFGYKNVHSVPKVLKIVVNIGTGRIAKDTKLVEKMALDLAKITGQKASVRAAKKSIAGFKLREGTPAGLIVTLRGTRMYDFMDRLVSIALPRSRDFQGISLKAFDAAGELRN